MNQKQQTFNPIYMQQCPDNGATNGDIVKTMFPHYDIEIDEHSGYVRIFYEDFYTTYPLRWWLAPYRKEGDGE